MQKELHPNIQLIIGPTAAGKTAHAIQLAKRLDAEIISADAYQVYRQMDIGTAKPSPEELAEVPHHMIDCLNPDAPFSVGVFMEMIRPIIDEIRSRGKQVIVCGGTGFYLNAFLYNIQFKDLPTADPKLREHLQTVAAEKGTAHLYDTLAAKDPESARRIGPHNQRRLIRALEIQELTQTSAAALNPPPPKQRDDVTVTLLEQPRPLLIERINQRVDAMMAQGLKSEVFGLFETYGTGCQAFTAIGYKEWMPVFHGQQALTDDEVADLIKTHTRQFARRQMTWYRKIVGQMTT